MWRTAHQVTLAAPTRLTSSVVCQDVEPLKRPRCLIDHPADLVSVSEVGGEHDMPLAGQRGERLFGRGATRPVVQRDAVTGRGEGSGQSLDHGRLQTISLSTRGILHCPGVKTPVAWWKWAGVDSR